MGLKPCVSIIFGRPSNQKYGKFLWALELFSLMQYSYPKDIDHPPVITMKLSKTVYT
jgi:hypothetical protein